jgi:hypothetical protein
MARKSVVKRMKQSMGGMTRSVKKATKKATRAVSPKQKAKGKKSKR